MKEIDEKPQYTYTHLPACTHTHTHILMLAKCFEPAKGV